MDEEPTSPQPIQETPKRRWNIWLAAGGCAILLCGMIFVGALIVAGPEFVTQFLPERIQVAESSPSAPTQNNAMGDPNAPVHIVEYGDFQCPYCLRFWSETEPQLIEAYVKTGQVYFEYRSVGSFLGEESGWAAEGAYCAGDQDMFWEYHDTLFTNWSGENVGDFTKDKLVEYARALGLNMEEFETCIREEEHKATVEQDALQAKAEDVHATPTLFINGVKIEGAQPFSTLKQYIEKILDGDLETQSG